MASPFSYGSFTDVATKSRLHSLGADSSAGLGTIDVGATLPADVIIGILETKTDTSGTPVWADGDFIEWYLGASHDDTTWAKGLDPDSASDHGTAVTDLVLIEAAAPDTWTAAGGDSVRTSQTYSVAELLGQDRAHTQLAQDLDGRLRVGLQPESINEGM